MARRGSGFASAAGLALALLVGASAAGAQQAQRISGLFIETGDNALTVKTEAGEAIRVALTANLTVARLEKATVADLKPGTFVGVGARPQKDGTQQAVQIVIFPESMRGTGEGHRAWGVMPEATMTNGAIAETVQAVDGPNFTLAYKGGAQKVTTPAEASILALKIVSRGDLKPGLRGQLVATPQGDGSLGAARVTLWAEGVTPY